MKSKINLHKIDEVFLSNLTELNFIEFEKLKENLKSGQIKEIFYMDEDFILGKINNARNFKTPVSSQKCTPQKKYKKGNSCSNIGIKDSIFLDNHKWRSSFKKERFPILLKKNEQILHKNENVFTEHHEKLSLNSINYKEVIEKEKNLNLDSMNEICEMNFLEFKEYWLKKEKDLKSLNKMILMGVKTKFIKSTEEFNVVKLKNDLYRSTTLKLV